MGILVGRGTAPVPFDIHALQKELKHLKAAALKKEQARYKILSDPDKKSLEFHDALKKKTTRARAKETDAKPDKEKPLPKPEPKVSRPNQNKKNAPGTDEKDKTTGEIHQTDQTALTIQVASFRNKKDADLMVLGLKAKGFSAYRALGVVPGKGVWYRVRVGHFNSRQKARKMAARLEGTNARPIILEQAKQ